MSRLLFFVFLYFVSLPSFASETLPLAILDSKQGSIAFKPYLRQYIDDPEGKLTPQQAWEKRSEFFPPEEMNQRFWDVIPTQDVWLAFRVQNSGNQTQIRYLSFDQLMPQAWMTCLNAQKTKPQTAGPDVPIEQRVLGVDKTAFFLTLTPHEELQCVIRFESVIPAIMTVRLHKKSSFYNWLEMDQHFYGLFFGAALFLIFYHLLLYFTLHQKALLYYSLMVGSIVIFVYFRDGFQGMWYLASSKDEPLNTQIVVYIMVMFAPWYPFFLMRYAREFTGLFIQIPKIRKLYSVYEYSFIVLIPFNIWNPVITGNIINLYLLVTFLFLLFLNFFQGIRGNRMAWWFLGSLGFNMVAFTLAIAETNHLLEQNLIVHYGYAIFSLIEFFMLAIVMNRRFTWRLQEMVAKQTAELTERTVELSETNHKLNTLNEEKNHFLNIAAHDLKSPLANLSAFAAMAVQELPEDETTVREYLTLMQQSSSTMAGLVGNLLDIDRIEAQVESVEAQPVNLTQTCKEIMDQFFPQQQQRGMGFELEAPAEPLQVMADPQWIGQVVGNLISNAFKFSPDHTRIVISLHEGDGRVRLAVSDQGPGIRPLERSKLFTKFGRLSNGPQNNEKSTGLGLHCVKMMMLRMDGEVYLDETYQDGARFVLAFKEIVIGSK